MKKISTLFLLAGCLLAGQFAASAQAYKWANVARYLGGYAFSNELMATDAAGNTYALVSFDDSIRVGNQKILGYPYSQLYPRASVLIKYDSTGQVQWTNRIAYTYVQTLTVDRLNGGVFFTAIPSAGATWNGTPITQPTGLYFYGKCGAGGGLQVQQSLGVFPGSAYVSSYSADGAGNYYLTGTVPAGTTWMGVTFSGNSSYVAKGNSNSGIDWVRQLVDSSMYVRGATVVAKKGGGCLLTSTLASLTLQFGSNVPAMVFPTNATNRSRPYVLDVDAAGSLRWSTFPQAVAGGRITVLYPSTVASDLAGNCYLTGGANALGSFTSQGFMLAKYNGSGALQWYRLQATGNALAYGQLLAVNDNGTEITASVTTDMFSTLPRTLLGAVTLKAVNNIVRFDGQGQAQWTASDNWLGMVNRSAGGNYPKPYYDLKSMGIDARGNVYSIGYSWDRINSAINTTSDNAALSIEFGTLTVPDYAFVVNKISGRNARVTGWVYGDRNGNGRPSFNEVGFAQPVVLEAVQAASTSYVTTERDGTYTMYADSGAYQFQLPRPPAHYTLTQPANGRYVGRLAGYTAVDSLRHFGLVAIANQPDLRVTVTPYGRARPGRITRYRATIENVGTTTTPAGSLVLTLDPQAQYESAIPAGTNVGQAITWSYGALAPFGLLNFDVEFSLLSTVAVGTLLNTTATARLAGDLVPADNTDTATQPVVSAFDPNEMRVSYSRITPAQVAAGLPLDYTIHFQNIGSDTAFAIVLQDTLNFRQLNLGTLQMVAQSHNCSWSLSGQGLLTIRFLSIKLPERNVDVLRSQGFVRFRVLPKASLVLGEVVPNRAHIFFDFNAPVRTNTVTTTVLLPTALLQNRTALAWDVYPNPSSGWVTAAAVLPSAGFVTLQLLDALGRVVQEHTLGATTGNFRQTLDISQQAPGLYMLRLRLPDGSVQTRPVVRK